MSDLPQEKHRCPWCGNDPIYVEYHNKTWGRPVRDSRELFEKLCLDGQQAGLSWITILKKSEGYKQAFAHFDPEVICQYSVDKVEELMLNPNIIRNRLKINSIIINAKAYLAYEKEHGKDSFVDFIWQFVDGKQKVNQWHNMEDLPAQTPESEAMSKALKKLGFNFVGPTICYAFMQAVGLVNDHLVNCHVYQECCEN